MRCRLPLRPCGADQVMPMPATAKGPVVVLGLPFLRAYSTVFDAENQKLGFLKSAELRVEVSSICKLLGAR